MQILITVKIQRAITAIITEIAQLLSINVCTACQQSFKVGGTSPNTTTIFTKRNNLRDFLFASLGN